MSHFAMWAVLRMRGTWQAAWLVVLMGSGCALPFLDVERGRETNISDAGTSASASTASLDPPATPSAGNSAPTTAGNADQTARNESQAMLDTLQQLQALRDVDPAAYEQLRADLQHSDPKLWPAMVQSFRAALNYRQRTPVAAQVGLSQNSTPGLQTSGATSSEAAPLAGPPVADDRAKQRLAGSVPRELHVQTGTPHSAVAASDLAWQQQLAATARALEQELGQSPDLSTGDRRHVYLRMMHLIGGQRDLALRPMPGMDAAEQEFWSQELFGLSKYLDIPAQPDRSRRAAEAARYLGEALPKLGQVAALSVKNISFCTEVSSYGVFTRFDRNEFQPGQQVLLYAEVENFTSEATPKGHHTTLLSSYQLFDSRGQRIEQHEFPLTEEFCQNPRRDFFVRYFLRMPPQILEGPHTLQLMVEDTLGHKVAQGKVEFQIKRAK